MNMIVTTRTLTETTLLDAVEVLVSAIDARNCSFGHSVRVASYAVHIAEATGCQEQIIEQIRLGALLHDIGQVYWPEEIINKQGRDSFFYNAFLTDFNQTFELASISTMFNSKSTEQDLLNFLTSIGCDVAELPQLRKEAEKFRQEFLSKI